MFPYPIYAVSCFITKIAAVEVTAKEDIELNLFSIRGAELRHLDRLFLTPLVGIGKITGRLRLKENRERSFLRFLRHNGDVYGNVHGCNSACKFYRHVHAKAKRAGSHCVKARSRSGKLITPGFEPNL